MGNPGSNVDLVLTIGFSLITLIWIVVVLTSTYSIMRMRDLPATHEVDLDTDNPPKVTVVLAARDEEDHIENTIRSLLAQKHVDLSVVIVNDGSCDETPTILDRMAEAEDRMQVIHIDELPERWIGKCYALHRGTLKAHGRWILLTDADIRMTPDVIARAVASAESKRAHHICLMPNQQNATRLGQASLLMLFLGMPNAFNKANRDKQGVGFGAFNLVRVDALHDIGGFETLRMEVVDDHQLGHLLHNNGKRTCGFFAGHDVEMDFARTPADVVRALEKNAFAMIRYNIGIACLSAIITAAMVLGAVAGPFTGTFTGLAASAGFLGLIVPGIMFARRFNWPVSAGLLAPLGFIVMLTAGANSIVKTLWSGGVRWHDRFYPLDELRQGMVRLKNVRHTDSM